MDNSSYVSYKIEDRSYLSFVKREIHNLLVQAGFSTTRVGEVDIIVSELTSNLIKHAGQGELLYRLGRDEENTEVFEIYCLDNGVGTDDIQRMMRDGVSTTNTLGNGLGAIQRLSNFFQVYSMSGMGTVVVSKNYATPPRLSQKSVHGLDIKALQVNYPGEQVCGDGYEVVRTDQETRIFVGDGLGHGPHAHTAVQEAIAAFRLCTSPSAVEVLRFIHQQVKKTRGLVASVAILNHETKKWSICGIGNISTRLHQGLQYKNYMSHNGIVGMNIPNTMHDFTAEANHFQTIVMCSDGIRTRWELSKYNGLLKYDAGIIASVLFKEHARRNDDMTVLVGKVNY